MPTAKLQVAIYNDQGVYKHWSLFFDGPSDDEKIIFHIMGSQNRYRYEKRVSDPRQSSSLVELLSLCQVDTSSLGEIEELAGTAKIHNEFDGYNCQDYVLDLLKALENEGIIDKQDKNYRKQRGKLRSKQEGMQ